MGNGVRNMEVKKAKIGTLSVAIKKIEKAISILDGFSPLEMSDEVRERLSRLEGAIGKAKSSVVSAEQSHLAMLETLNWLKEKLEIFQAWEVEQKKYVMKRFDPGVIAYQRKTEAYQSKAGDEQLEAADPAHLLCAKCFERKKRSILQATPKIERRYPVFKCHECRSEYAFYDDLEENLKN
jgi:hypothetical protein